MLKVGFSSSRFESLSDCSRLGFYSCEMRVEMIDFIFFNRLQSLNESDRERCFICLILS